MHRFDHVWALGLSPIGRRDFLMSASGTSQTENPVEQALDGTGWRGRMQGQSAQPMPSRHSGRDGAAATRE